MDTPEKQRIGEILCKEAFITRAQLEEAIKIQNAGNKEQLGQILLDLGYITKYQLAKSITIQDKINKPSKAAK